jgi:hypothetical protein
MERKLIFVSAVFILPNLIMFPCHFEITHFPNIVIIKNRFILRFAKVIIRINGAGTSIQKVRLCSVLIFPRTATFFFREAFFEPNVFVCFRNNS